MEPDHTKLGEGVVDTRANSSTPPLLIGDQGSSQANVFDKHRRLMEWVLANDGYFHPDAQIAFSSRKGFHVVVADGKQIASGSRIASCPMPVTLSVLNALNVAPFSNNGTSFPEPFLRSQLDKPESLQAFFLMEQLVIGDRSWWGPYIATLPTVQNVADLQFEDEADIRWLEGTNLKAGISTRLSKWQEMYSQGVTQLQKLGWANACNGVYTWPQFRWAATIFGSRSFTSQVLDDTLPSDMARLQSYGDFDDRYDLVNLFSQRFAVLLPLLDLLNHRPGARVEWQARCSFVGLQVLEAYESGQELYNNYGPRDNEALLLAYGFTIQDNPFDHVVISIKTPTGSPLEIVRKWKQDLRSDPEHRCFIFSHQHPRSTSATSLEASVFSFDLLDNMSVLCANERELQAMYARSQTLMSYSLSVPPRFEDGRIILATLSQLLMDCSARASKLRATDPSRMSPFLEPANQKQRHAKTYRDSQLHIVETAIAICKFVLSAATRESTDEAIFSNLRQETPEAALKPLQTLAARYGRLTHPCELLSAVAILEMLPKELSYSFKNHTSALESSLRTQLHGTQLRSSIRDKTRFAVILSAIYGEYIRGVKFRSRISVWIKQLAEWYAPDDRESWAYVPTSGPWAPGYEPPTDLMNLLAASKAMSMTVPAESNIKQWFRPDRLCWGWNVMEEEMVCVPTSILKPDNKCVDAWPEPISILIYLQKSFN